MPTRVYRFGVFELNTATQQLLKQGRRVRLQQQPRQALELLLEAQGRLVTRQELRQRLWPSGVHVDYELGLTGAIKRLRLALDDSAETPRFVETVPKCGYRFVAPVQVVSPPDRTVVTPPPVAPAQPVPTTAVARPRRRTVAGILVAVAVVGVAAGVGLLALRAPLPPPSITRVVKLTRSGRAWPQESLLSDGARLYYTEFVVGTGYRLRQILLNGNEDTVAPGLPSHTLFRALSPDHTTFIAISQDDAARGNPSPLWTVPVVGGVPRRLGSVRTNDFAWSPDGGSLAYAEEGRLLLATADADNPRLLATAPGHVICPRWSPDGRRLRFTVLGGAGELALWEVGADGSGARALRFDWPGPPMEGFGDWTPDGRHFVFVSRRDGVSNLWALEEGSDWRHRRRREPVQLTAGPVSYGRPLPSLDGKRVFALGTEPGGELVRYDGAQREFVRYLGGRAAEHLDWSRDGRWVAYAAYPEGTLWRAHADGSDALQLTTPPLRAAQPRWSPDGTRILFTGTVAGTPARILVVSADGGTPEPLVAEPHAQADPCWSPAGDSVVYGGDRDSGGRLALYRLDLGSGRRQRIPGTEGLHAPLWSPDGRRLAARDAASGRLVLCDLRSGRRLTLTRRTADYPAWSADSQFLQFNSPVGEQMVLFRVHVPDGAEEKVAEVPFKPAGSWGSWSGLAPDGSPLVLRDRGQTDVYALSVSFAEGR